jgi:Uma2 family endonuclease
MALTKPAGEWRYEDLVQLPDDGKRYEIIEGALYEMPAPGVDHATIVMNLIALLLPIITEMGGRLFTAPIDVRFHGADPVQPDLLAVLPGWSGALRLRSVTGAPDLLIEVLSPSNRGHDLLTKRALYARAGVREYWIVDPAGKTVDILMLDRDAFHTVQRASGENSVISSLLEDTAFPLTAIFAGVDQLKA